MTPERQSQSDGVERRTVLKRAGLTAGGLVLGAGAFAGQAAASARECDGCLQACWVDVKPNSCPNSVNPNSAGVLPVVAGWPNFDVSTVELVPVKGSYDAAFGDCQDFEDPQYHTGSGTAAELCELAAESDRSARPTWSTTEDVDGDGDDDTKFKFEVSDLDLEPADTFLVLRGETAGGDCTFLGIDSVRVLAGGNAHGDASGAPSRGRD